MSGIGHAVDAAADPPRFLQPLQSVVAVEGGSACFEAVVSGTENCVFS